MARPYIMSAHSSNQSHGNGGFGINRIGNNISKTFSTGAMGQIQNNNFMKANPGGHQIYQNKSTYNSLEAEEFQMKDLQTMNSGARNKVRKTDGFSPKSTLTAMKTSMVTINSTQK